ncbi:AMP-binding protein, partial [Porticoccaceae bacterium]|nr:AMP-binding protein [Porticoccaceae bacterium]
MGTISNVKEVFRVMSDVARALPVVLAKLPESDEAASLGLVLEETVARHPDNIMIIFEDREITWGEFNQLTNQLARALLDRGVVRGDCVAVIMENRIEMLVAILACQKIGAIAGMVNPALTGPQLAHCINITDSVKCLAGEEIFNSVLDVCPELKMKDSDILWVADKRESSAPDAMEDIMPALVSYETGNLEETKAVLAGDTGFYIFTSGTTGMPKAAKVGQRRILAAGSSFSKVGV